MSRAQSRELLLVVESVNLGFIALFDKPALDLKFRREQGAVTLRGCERNAVLDQYLLVSLQKALSESLMELERRNIY
jgi:hypothetical protein